MKKAVLAAVLYLQACGSSSSVDSTLSEVNLEGMWRTNCFESSVNNQTVYAVKKLTFTGNDLIDDFLYFSDIACAQPQDLGPSVWSGSSGTYRILGTVNTTSGVLATEVEYTFFGNNVVSDPVVINFAIQIDGNILYQGFKSSEFYTLNFLLPYNRVN